MLGVVLIYRGDIYYTVPSAMWAYYVGSINEHARPNGHVATDAEFVCDASIYLLLSRDTNKTVQTSGRL